MNLNNKTVVITGGTDGLGLALAKELLTKKAKVVVLGKDEAKLQRIEKELGVRAFRADVRDFGQLEAAAKNVGEVDVLINNAGNWAGGSIEEIPAKTITNVIEVTLRGVIYSTKAFLPILRKALESHLVNIISTSGLKGREFESLYVATKYGVSGFTESLKIELANTSVKVSGFYPGGMNTKMYDKAGMPKENQDWMDTAKIAKIIVFMLEQDATMVMDQVVVNRRMTKKSN